MTKPKPRPDAEDDDGRPNQIHRGIGEWPGVKPDVKPAVKAASSIYAAGAAARPRRKNVAIDLSTVPIEEGHEIPPPNATRAAGYGYRQLLQRMGPGKSVTLPMQAARGLVAFAKKEGRKTVFRKLDADTARVWAM